MSQQEIKPKQDFKNSLQRRILFINRDLQFGFMFFVVASIVLAVLLMGYEILSVMQNLYVDYPMILQPLYDKLIPFTLTLSLKLSIYLILVILVCAVVSNRMAGPIYRVEQTCRDIEAGDLTKRVRLRKGDKFMSLQDSFNSMMDKLEKKINNKKED